MHSGSVSNGSDRRCQKHEHVVIQHPLVKHEDYMFRT